MPIHLTCPTCESAFTRKPCNIRPVNYCSRRCQKVRPPLPVVMAEDGLTAFIPLRNRKGDVIANAIVDAADVPLVNKWSWSLNSYGYATRGVTTDGRVRQVLLHRELLGLVRGDGLDGDHLNRIPLDCRRSNLRILPHAGRPNSQNAPSQRGTSSYRGVCWKVKAKKWVAQIQTGGKVRFLGYFDDEAEAGEAARAARVQLMPYATD